jgi:hypothetical protein
MGDQDFVQHAPAPVDANQRFLDMQAHLGERFCGAADTDQGSV